MAEEYCYPHSRAGLADFYEMTWRCAKCGYCRNVFPSDTEHERYGRQCPPGERFRYESYFASGRNELARRTIEGKQGPSQRLRHILYSCTTCNACEEWCEATQGLYPMAITRAMRKHYLESGGELLPEHQKTVDSVRQNHNRLNRNNRDRLAWLPPDDAIPKTGNGTSADKVDLLYFVGCRSAFQRTEIARATYDLLRNKLGAKIGFLADERCCGRPLLDLGKEEDALEVMKHNLAAIEASGAERVLFTCAECFHSFNTVERYGLQKSFEPVHLSQYLAAKVESGELRMRGEQRQLAFHDPCYLGRYEGVYEAPRAVMESASRTPLVELPRNRKNAWCCGSGGGVAEGMPEYSQWTACERIEEATTAGAEVLVTSCPGCKDSLRAAVGDQKLEILDLVELVARSVGA